MSRKLWIISILFFFAISFAAKDNKGTQNEFAGIPFGMDRQKVIEEILKLGYEPYGMAESSDRVVIPVFMMGDLPVQVDFLFNRNDKFYSFEIRTGRVEEARIGKVFEAVDYMGDQFCMKYGEPGQKPAVTERDLRNGTNVYQEWFSIRTLNVSTAIVFKDGRLYSVGAVTNRTLANEKLQEAKAGSANRERKAAF